MRTKKEVEAEIDWREKEPSLNRKGFCVSNKLI